MAKRCNTSECRASLPANKAVPGQWCAITDQGECGNSDAGFAVLVDPRGIRAAVAKPYRLELMREIATALNERKYQVTK